MRSNREKDLENIINEMYSPADIAVGEDEQQQHDNPPIEEGDGIGSTVSGDPSTWKVGQIVPSSVSKDDYDGIILGIGEEDGERTFDLYQVGPEGWTVPESDLNLPDDDTGRIPSDALAGSKHDYKSDPVPGLEDSVDESGCNSNRKKKKPINAAHCK